MKLTKHEEWEAMREVYQDYFPLFETFHKMGEPIFTDKIPTAAVSFDKKDNGKFINFIYNPKFWNRCTKYERSFITAHESLHVFLNHGMRSQNLPVGEMELANIAMDVVVNHLLVENFGFDRDKIKFEKDLCWIDTVFKNIPGGALPRQNFEYYFALLRAHATMVPVTVLKLVDDHSGFQGKDTSNIMKEVGKQIDGDPDLESDAAHLEQHQPQPGAKAGTGQGDWSTISREIVREKWTWERLFKKLFRDWTEAPEEQWARMPRRFMMLDPDLILPSEMEEEEKLKTKVRIWLFIDASGSCSGMVPRFVKAYKTIPKKMFEVRAFSFDTQAQELDVVNNRLYGGGGTAFSCIESEIRRIMKSEDVEYPQVVAVFTDGDGNFVSPKHPERWHWFLDDRQGNTMFIPKQSKTFCLLDFE